MNPKNVISTSLHASLDKLISPVYVKFPLKLMTDFKFHLNFVSDNSDSQRCRPRSFTCWAAIHL